MGHAAAVVRILGSAAPHAAPADRAMFARMLRLRRRPAALLDFLESPSRDEQRVAIACLGVFGAMPHTRALAALLRHPDPAIARTAENSLWTIWLRSGSPQANRVLAIALARLKRGDYAAACHTLNDLCAAEPMFAEAHFQRGVVQSLLERPAEAAAGFGQALRLNPLHFGAALGLACTYVERGDLDGALRHYRQALELHPRLEGVPEAVCRLESVVSRGGSV